MSLQADPGPGLLSLAGLERVVEDGLRTFLEVGHALAEIHRRGLFRETHRTWESYCVERWGFTRQHAGRLIQAAAVVTELKVHLYQEGEDAEPMGDVLSATRAKQEPLVPDSERAARPLGRLKTPRGRQQAWEEARARAGGGQPTAAQVQETVQRVLAGMTAAQQLDFLSAEEAELERQAAPLAPKPERERQKQRALKHLAKARNPLVTRGDAAAIVALIDRALALTTALP